MDTNSPYWPQFVKIQMNTFDIQIVVIVLHFALSVASFISFFARNSSELQHDIPYQFITLAAALAMQIIQTVISYCFLRQMKEDSQVPTERDTNTAYMKWLIPLVTLSNTIRLVTFCNLTPILNTPMQFPLELCLQLISYQQFTATQSPLYRIRIPLVSLCLYSCTLGVLAISRVDVYQSVHTLLLISSVFVYLISHLNQHPTDENKSHHSLIIPSTKMDQRSNNVVKDKFIQNNNVNIMMMNPLSLERNCKRVFESPRSLSDICSSQIPRGKADYLLTFSHMIRNSPIATAIIDSCCIPHTFNEAFGELLGFQSKSVMQNVIQSIKVLKTNKKASVLENQSVRRNKNSWHSEANRLGNSTDSQFFSQPGRTSYNFNDVLLQVIQSRETMWLLDFESNWLSPHKTMICVSVEHNIAAELNRNVAELQTYYVVYLVNIEDKQRLSAKQVTLKLMNQLFRSFSHEFSTSLNGIQGIAQAAEEELQRSHVDHYITPILNSCSIMNSIVQDIRDFSMLLSKKFMVRIEQVNLSLLVGNCYRLFAKQFEMRNIEFEYCPDETTICIHTDGARLQQIIINLLSNAQKHTKNGFIRLYAVSDDQRQLKITVEDQGTGMEDLESERLNRLLNNQWSKISQHDDRQKNFGLGLMISNQLALELCKLKRNQGGGIHFSSKLNQGSSFWFMVADQPNESPSKGLIGRASPMVRVDRRTIYRVSGVYQLSSERFTFKQEKKVTKNSILFENSSRCQFQSQLSDACKEPSVRTLRSKKVSFREVIPSEPSDDESCSADGLLIDEGTQQPVSLPFRPSSPLRKSPPSLVTLSTKGRKCSCIRTIIIDDEYINIMAMQMLLRGFGIAVDHAYDGIEGTQKVIQRLQNPCKICGSAYILVLMDIDMPGINGFEATKRIVSFCELTLQRKPIIIAQTAFVDAESQNQCFTVGMNHFLSKPISKTELRNALTFFEMI